MRPHHAPAIPTITTTCRLYEQILAADHILIIPEDQPPAPGLEAYSTTRQCLLSRRRARAEADMLLKMVGG